MIHQNVSNERLRELDVILSRISLESPEHKVARYVFLAREKDRLSLERSSQQMP